MVGATTIVPPTNETGVCEETICSKLEYYDKLKQKCRDFPGGGFLVIMDHVFSDTEKRCIGETLNQPNTIKVHDESQNCNIIVPDCSGVGLFPIPSNCSFYFKCQEYNYNFHQYVYQCPPGTFFHPDLQKCSSTNKCYEAQEEILHNFSKEYFPECLIYGQFRTAKDCTLYYRCVPNIDGSFYQIRYECPYKMSYNIEKELCVPEHLQCCEYIPHERIIEQYKVQHSIDATTLLPQPTTVISAINTKITSSIPMLVCGDVRGKLKSFFARIENVNKKSGPFDLVLCVGDFFGTNPEVEVLQEYKRNIKTVSAPVYILGPTRKELAQYYADTQDGDICTNLSYLGKRGVYTTSGGLKIAYLSGNSQETGSNEWTYSKADAMAVRDSCLASKANMGDFRGIDILLTSQWPFGMQEKVKESCKLVSWLANAVKPRYHFCGMNDEFYESPPYRNLPDKNTQMELATRFVGLASFGNPEKKKHIYALSITPVEKMRVLELIQKTTDEIPSPYQNLSLLTESGATNTEEKRDDQYFYDMSTPDDNRRNKRRSNDPNQHQQNNQKRGRPTFDQESCWFCLSAGSIEKHLIISVGDHFYLALAKGPITETHILILSITHIQCAALLSEPQWAELVRFKQALVQFYADRDQKVFFYERNFKTGHLQINAIGIDDNVAWKIQHVLEDKGEEFSVQLEKVPKLTAPSDLPERGPYFVAELPDDTVMLTRQMKGFPLHFGREIICADNLLNCEEKADWRQCNCTKEEEDEMVKNFRESFKPYDFTV
uniref:Chitin-binding type-2 domain-containing protein n=1 Tax=Anopheles melas TaxID=34690 RepID=A0A182TZS0_9DIPT